MREGKPNDLAERLAADPLFSSIDLAKAMDGLDLAGRAPEQVDEFLAGPVAEALASCPRRAAAETLRV
jgi:hypothetical protein